MHTRQEQRRSETHGSKYMDENGSKLFGVFMKTANSESGAVHKYANDVDLAKF